MQVRSLLLALAMVVGPVATGLVAGAGTAQAQSSPVPTPTLTEVPYDVGIHGHPMWDPWFDIEAFGYEAHEYFVSGTATITGGTDTADYTTRIVVTHPSDPADFAGTVMLDWVNVTAQFENAVNTATSIQFLLREGWAWVHVSAQAVGICCSPLTPQVYDPVRYADLSHPGDDYANDMFSQVAQAFKQPGEVHPLKGMDAEVVIAAGQSQSASRLTDYMKTTAASANVIDAFLIQATGSADPGKLYDVAPSAPVINLLGEREGTPTEPTPHPTYRLWEVAGGAHQDQWVGRQQTEGASTRLFAGVRQPREFAEMLWQSAGQYGEQLDPREEVCIVNGATFPNRYASNAALWHLDNWVRTGTPAPQPPRYEFDGTAIARDGDRNALGGLRLAPIDVPVARYLADSCNLGGITIPFTDAELIQRYGDHATYFAQMQEAVAANVADGYLLRADAADLLTRACNARNRFGEPQALAEACTVEFSPEPEPEPQPEPEPEPAPQPESEPASLPATGGGAALAGLALLAWAAGRRRVGSGSGRRQR